MLSMQLALTVLKIILINVGKIGWCEKYEQTICFLPVNPCVQDMNWACIRWKSCVWFDCVLCPGVPQRQIWDPVHTWGGAFWGDSLSLAVFAKGSFLGDACASLVLYCFLGVIMEWKVYCLSTLTFALLLYNSTNLVSFKIRAFIIILF